MTVPVSTFTDTWWQAVAERTLLVQRCRTCDNHQHYPREHCLDCGGSDLEFVTASGVGRVVSFSEVHRSPDAERFEAPYTIAVVELKEGASILTRLISDDPTCDATVTLDWATVGGTTLPVFVEEGR